MLAFVDESGDCGMKLAEGSSRFFTVAVVLFEDHEEALACDAGINALRNELPVSHHKEFHFSKDNDRIRTHFLEQVARYQFFYLAIVLNKAKLFGPGFRFKDSFYKYAVSLVFQNAKPYLDQAIVVADRTGDKKFKSQLVRYLKRRVNDSRGGDRIKKVKTEKSHTNNLLQLADMVCGAVARSYNSSREGATKYRDLIRARELRVQVWPRATRGA